MLDGDRVGPASSTETRAVEDERSGDAIIEERSGADSVPRIEKPTTETTAPVTQEKPDRRVEVDVMDASTASNDAMNAATAAALPTIGRTKKGVAFFDMDHTIIDVNSSWLWVKSEINSGRVGFSLIGTAVYWFARYAAGYGDGAETAGKDAASLYKGETESSLAERIRDFFRMELAHRTRPGFKAVLEAHKANDERCVMCTSTWQHPAEIGAQIYGLETGESNVVSSIMGVDEHGLMDGTIQVVAYGDGKYETTKRWCDQNGIDLKDCYFYTDSMSDVKLLEHVGYPVCVNPDSRLKKHAAERGWKIVDWGKSQPALSKPRYNYCLTCSA